MTKRRILAPIIATLIALGAAGSILAGSAAPALAAQAPSSHVHVVAASPKTHYWG